MSRASGSSPPVVLVLGASGPTGQALLPLLAQSGGQILAVSRTPPTATVEGVLWFQHDLADAPFPCDANTLISAGPLELAVRQAESIPALGRVVALSSASVLFKQDSGDAREKAVIARLLESEERMQAICDARNAALTLFRPALIYGGGDGNVERLGSLVERLPVVPVAGRGRRHPVHAADLARIMVRAISENVAGTFALGGGETLDYMAMLERIAEARGAACRVVRLPAWAMVAMLKAAHGLGRLEDVRPVMIRRQAADLLVNDEAARERLGWAPGGFRPDRPVPAG